MKHEDHVKAHNYGMNTHLLAAGKSDAFVKAALAKFPEVKKARISRSAHIAQTLLGKPSQAFAQV